MLKGLLLKAQGRAVHPGTRRRPRFYPEGVTQGRPRVPDGVHLCNPFGKRGMFFCFPRVALRDPGL